MKHTVWVLALGLFLRAGTLTAEPIKINSSNLRELVEGRNPRLEAARAEVAAAKEREGYLERSFLPSLEIYAAGESFKTGLQAQKSQPAYGAELKLNLLNGGRDQAGNEIRKLETQKRGYQQLREGAEQLELTRRAYWEILFLREKIKSIESSLQLNRQNLQSAQRRIRSGLSTDSDRFEFEMRDVDLRRERSHTELLVLQGQKNLAVLLALAPDENLQLSESLAHEHDYELELKDVGNEAEFLFKAEELQSEQALRQAEAEGKEAYPKLDAYAAYSQFNEREEEFAEARDRTQSVVGLRLSMSLSRGLESRSEARALRQEASATKRRSEQMRTEAKSFISLKLAELKVLHDQVHEAEENIVRAERYYRLTQSEYGRGVKNSPDVLGAAEKLFGRQQKRLEIVRDFQVAKAEVLSRLGR